jgi:hypothetical protein
LNLIELLDLAPGFVADGTGYIDFQSDDGHKVKISSSLRVCFRGES